ncbi:MAG: hypothetical protein EBR73_00585 [Rhodobacteraceae bacterium]|nr:hypothetical protein [Paracoccaceae bacterium]
MAGLPHCGTNRPFIGPKQGCNAGIGQCIGAAGIAGGAKNLPAIGQQCLPQCLRNIAMTKGNQCFVHGP